MLRYEFFSHLIPSLVYLLIISILRIGHYGPVDFLMLWSGGLIGTFFIDIDHLIYCLFTRPNQPCSLKVQELLKKKDYRNAFLAMVNTHLEHQELTFHNAIFIPIWIIFCLFILTSSGSIFASALVMAMYVHLLKDIWEDVRIKKNYQLDTWFWQIKIPLEETIKKYLVWTFNVAFLLLTLFFIK